MSTAPKETAAQKRAREEREFLATLPPDRFGVNPTGERAIEPKGPRKGSKRKVAGL